MIQTANSTQSCAQVLNVTGQESLAKQWAAFFEGAGVSARYLGDCTPLAGRSTQAFSHSPASMADQTINLATEGYGYEGFNKIKPHILLEKQQAHVHVKPRKALDFKAEIDYQNTCRKLAASEDHPLLYIIGHPQPYDYSVMLFPPRYNSRLYRRFSNARMGFTREDDSTSLWLIQDKRFFKVQKIWAVHQLKHHIPVISGELLQRGFTNASAMLNSLLANGFGFSEAGQSVE